MRVWIAPTDAHELVPFIGNTRQMRIECGAQASNRAWQRVREIPVLALAEAVARHVDMAAEMLFMRVESGNPPALLRRQDAF